MAESVVINIEANTTGLQSTIDLLVKLGQVEQKVADDFRKTNEANVKSIQTGVQQTTGQFEKLGQSVKNIKADNKLAESLDATAPLVRTGNSLKTFQQQLKEATKEVNLLAAEFGPLDARTLAAAKRVQELKAGIEDTNRSINALKPEGKFQAIQNLGGAIAGIFQVATGALQAFGIESEKATKIAQQFQGALNIFGGLSQLSQLKDSLAAVKVALGLTTVATVEQAAATEGAAVAQGTLNTTILANPYVAAAAAIGALIGAMILFGDTAEDTKAAQKKLNDEIQRTADLRKQTGIEALDSELKLLVATGEKTQAEAERIQLQRNSKREQDKIQDDINKKQAEYEKGQARIAANERTIAAQRQRLQGPFLREGAELTINRTIELLEKENEATKKTNESIKQSTDNLRAAKNNINTKYSNEFAANLAVERKNAADNEKKKEEDANKAAVSRSKSAIKTAKEIADEELKIREDLAKKEFEQDINNLNVYNQNSINAITDSYNEREKIAAEAAKKEQEANLENLKNGLINLEQYEKRKAEIVKNIPDFTKDRAISITQNEVTQLELRIQNFKDYGKDTADLEAQLAAKRIELQKQITAKEQEENAKRLSDTEATELAKLAAAQKAKDLRDKLSQEIIDLGVDTFIKGVNDAFDAQIGNIEDLKDAQLKAIEEEDQKIQESYDNRLIGKRQLELEQERLTKERIKAEEKAEKRIIEIKKKQDIANKAKALFQIYINTAATVTKTTAELGAVAAAPLIPLIIAQGALQAAAVIAQPLPKYKKGTLSIPGTGNEDSHMAMLQPGEAVIPTETNKKYHPAIKAIYEQKITPTEINNFVSSAINKKEYYDRRVMPSELKQFVNLKLKSQPVNTKAEPITAKMEVADLYALGRIIRKNDGVTVKNIKELASIFADNYNPRR